MGQTPSSPNPLIATKGLFNQLNKNLPGLLSMVNANVGPSASAQLAATQATQPAYNQLNLDQTREFALPLAQVGQQVTNSNALAGAQTNVNQLNGAGGTAADSALAVNQRNNPAYYSNITNATNRSNDLLNSINLNGLSGGETAAVERSLNQSNYATGNLGLDNATNTVTNAMNFGNALQAKRAALGSAIGTATNVANTAAGNGGFNAVNVALGQPNQSANQNFGTGTFSGTNAQTQQGAGAGGGSTANALLGSMFGFAGQQNTNATNASVASYPAYNVGANL